MFRGRTHFLAAIPLALALAAPARADTVSTDYTVAQGAWNSGGTLTLYSRVREEAGRVAVCGAWSMGWEASGTIFLNESVVDAAHLSIAGERIVTGLGFMTRLPKDGGIGGTAACKVTGAPWRPEYAAAEPEVRFPRMVFIDDDISGEKHVFRQLRN